MSSLFVSRVTSDTKWFEVKQTFEDLFGSECVKYVSEIKPVSGDWTNFRVDFNNETELMESFKAKMEQDNVVYLMTGKGKMAVRLFQRNRTRPQRVLPRMMTDEEIHPVAVLAKPSLRKNAKETQVAVVVEPQDKYLASVQATATNALVNGDIDGAFRTLGGCYSASR